MLQDPQQGTEVDGDAPLQTNLGNPSENPNSNIKLFLLSEGLKKLEEDYAYGCHQGLKSYWGLFPKISLKSPLAWV